MKFLISFYPYKKNCDKEFRKDLIRFGDTTPPLESGIGNATHCKLNIPL